MWVRVPPGPLSSGRCMIDVFKRGTGVKKRVGMATIHSKLRSYGRIYGWLMKDIARAQAGRSLLVVILSLLSVATRIIAIGLALLYAKARSTGQPVQILDWEFHASNESSNLLLWSGAVLSVALMAAAFTYLAEWTAFQTAKKYIIRANELILDAYGTDQPARSASDSANHLRRLLSRDTNMVLRASLILMRSVMPVFLLIGAVIGMFVIHSLLSVIVLLLGTFYAVPFFLLNAQVIRASRKREQHVSEVGAGVRRLLPMILHRRGPSDSQRKWSHLFHESMPIEQNLSALKDILLARKRVGFLQDVYLGVALVLSLVVFGLIVADRPSSWVEFIAYLAALRFVSTSMKTIASTVTTTNRFLPQVRRYVEFVQPPGNAETIAAEESADVDTDFDKNRQRDGAPMTLRCSSPQLRDSKKQIAVHAGEIIFAIDPLPLHVAGFRRWCRRFCGGAREGERLWRDAFFLGKVSRLPELAIGDIMTGDVESAVNSQPRIEAVLDSLGLFSEYRKLPNGIKTKLDESTEATISRRMRYAMLLMEAIVSDPSPIVLQWEPLTAMGDSFSGAILEQLKDRVVIIAGLPAQFRGGSTDILLPKGRWAVIMEGAMLGMGDAAWYESIQSELLERWRPEIEARAVAVEAGVGDAALDDDDDDE